MQLGSAASASFHSATARSLLTDAVVEQEAGAAQRQRGGRGRAAAAAERFPDRGRLRGLIRVGVQAREREQ